MHGVGEGGGGGGGGGGGALPPTLGHDCTLKFNEEKISSCSRGGCARKHFGLKFAREMSVVCGGMQLKSRYGQDIGQDVHDGATSSCQF